MQAQSPAKNGSATIGDTGKLALWTLAWLVTLAFARFGPSAVWDYEASISWTFIVLNLLAGVGWMIAHARYLQRVDELQRKIMLDALAVTVGVGLIGGCAIAAAGHAELISSDTDIAALSILMGLTYAAATVAGNLRYR